MRYLIVWFITLMMAGCSVHPRPMTMEEIKDRARADGQAMFAGQEPVRGPVDLYESMARAIKYNLDHRLKLMEGALEIRRLDSSRRDMLPRVVTSAGYSHRSNYSGAYSQSLLDGRESLEASTSQERDVLDAEISMMWNILDFGVSYIRARQQADQVLIAEERRRKVLQNIIQDVRYAYCRAASADALLAEMSALLEQARSALIRSRQISGQRLQPATESLEYQRALLENIRLLWSLIQKLNTAKSEMAALMNLSPGADFKLDPPNWDRPEIPTFTKPVSELEELAMLYRPELREEDYRAQMSALEAKKAILKMLPGISLDMGYNYSNNQFLYNKDWWNAGAQISMNIFDLFSGPAEYQVAKGQQKLDRTRRYALGMAVLTQVHLAYQRYHLAREEYKVTRMLDDVNGSLQEQMAASESAGKSDKLAVIESRTQALVAKMRHHLAYAEVQNAAGRIYNSIGIDPLPVQASRMSVNQLARRLKKSFAHWDEMVNNTDLASRPPDEVEKLLRQSARAAEPSEGMSPLRSRAEARTEASPSPTPSQTKESRSRAETSNGQGPALVLPVFDSQDSQEDALKDSLASADRSAPLPRPNRKAQTEQSEPEAGKAKRSILGKRELSPVEEYIHGLAPGTKRSQLKAKERKTDASKAEEKKQPGTTLRDQMLRVTRDAVMIHTRPSFEASILAEAASGQTLEMIGQPRNGWAKVRTEAGKTGWVSTAMARPVEAEAAGAMASKGDDPDTAIQIDDQGRIRALIKTTTRANVRSGPGFEFEVKKVEAKGVRYKSTDRTKDWYKIQLENGVEGWLHQSVVAVLAGQGKN